MIDFLRNLAVIALGIAVSFIIAFGFDYTNKLGVNEESPHLEEIDLEKIDRNEDFIKETPETETQEKVEEISPTTTKKKDVEIIIKSEPETVVETNQNQANNLIDLIVSIPPINDKSILSVNEVNTLGRKALVNVICTSKGGGLLQPITGSGMIINDNGVILTNAHIGQYFLLKDYSRPNFLECNIRTGSPAVNTYKADLLYISPSWVKNNSDKISSSNPKGTGEDDFALLLITGTTQVGASLPAKFPFVPLDIRGLEPEINDFTLVMGYPAGFLGGQTIQKELYAVSTVATVMDIFTFANNTLDLFSVGGNIAAQKGSSGGGILSFSGNLLGIVVTASEGTKTDDRDLRAITPFHINESFKKDNNGTDLNNYLLGNLFNKSIQFREVVAPELTSLLESALSN